VQRVLGLLQWHRRLGVHDAASGRHPLRAPGGHDAGVAGGVAMLLAPREQVGHGLDARVRMRANPILAGRDAERSEMVQEYPRSHGMAPAIGQGAAHGERADGSFLRLHDAFDVSHIRSFDPGPRRSSRPG
jgi:hypothetical protein